MTDFTESKSIEDINAAAEAGDVMSLMEIKRRSHREVREAFSTYQEREVDLRAASAALEAARDLLQYVNNKIDEVMDAGDLS